MLQVRLKIIGGKHDGKAIPLTTDKFLIGREADCHLRPNSELVSRHHCALTVDQYVVRIRDLGSTNGTFVNGEAIRGQVVLNAGDRVKVGKLEVEVLITEVTAPVAAAAPTITPILPVSVEPIPIIGADTAEMNSSDTVYELPAYNATGDSTVIHTSSPTGDTAILAPGTLPPVQDPNQYAAPQPPQYGGYPSPPGYPPGYGQPMGYPGQYPGMPMGGQYPQYPYGAPPMGYPPPMFPPQQGGYPPPGYGQPQGYPPQGGQPEMNTVDSSATKLPDPSDIQAPQAHVPKVVDPNAPKADNPSDRAAAIIRQHMQRRST